ncbi:hypothetical protein JCM10212_006894 [Sporobolomyces blumeae]
MAWSNANPFAHVVTGNSAATSLLDPARPLMMPASLQGVGAPSSLSMTPTAHQAGTAVKVAGSANKKLIGAEATYRTSLLQFTRELAALKDNRLALENNYYDAKEKAEDLQLVVEAAAYEVEQLDQGHDTLKDEGLELPAKYVPCAPWEQAPLPPLPNLYQLEIVIA